MCVAVPSKIVEIEGDTATVEVTGTHSHARLDLIEDAQIGDYVLVHVGFAISVIDAAEAARSRGVKTVAVTAGYVNAEPRQEFYAHMDAANIDLKALSEEFYRDICSATLKPVLNALTILISFVAVVYWVKLFRRIYISGRHDEGWLWIGTQRQLRIPGVVQQRCVLLF